MSLKMEGESAPAQLPASHPELFVRNATGLVRNLSQTDNLGIAFISGLPIAGLAFGVFFALSGFPGGNFYIGGLLCIPITLAFAYTYGLLASAIPRSGGDYMLVSRILTPSLSLVSMFSMTLAQVTGIAFFGKGLATLAVAPGLQITGLAAGSRSLFDAGATVASSHGWQFAIALAMILACAAVHLFGTMAIRRAVVLFTGVSMFGLLVSFVVALVTSKGTFINHFNAFAQPYTHSADSYQASIVAAQKAGVSLTPAFSLSKTLPIIGVFASFGIYSWGGAYIAGELREASSIKTARRMGLGGLMTILTTLLFAAVFFHAWGRPFLAAIYGGGLSPKLGSAPTYFFLTSAQLGSPVIAAVLCFAFILFWPIGVLLSMITPVRSLFAMGFDGVMPRAVANVTDRYNAPAVAIAVTGALCSIVLIWAIFISTSFAQVLVYAVLIQLISMGLVGLSAVVFPFRRPELFRASSAQRVILGLPLCTIAGVGALVACVFLYWLYFKYPYFGLTSKGPFFIWAIGVVLVALVSFHFAKIMRRRQGVDLDLVYAEIPPE